MALAGLLARADRLAVPIGVLADLALIRALTRLVAHPSLVAVEVRPALVAVLAALLGLLIALILVPLVAVLSALSLLLIAHGVGSPSLVQRQNAVTEATGAPAECFAGFSRHFRGFCRF